MDDSVRSSRTAEAERAERVALDADVFVVSSYGWVAMCCAVLERDGRAVMVVRDLEPTVEAAPMVRCGVEVRGGDELGTCEYGSGKCVERGESETLEVDEGEEMELGLGLGLGLATSLCAFWIAVAKVTGRVVAWGVAKCVCLAGEETEASDESDGLEKDELWRCEGAKGVLVVVREALMSRVSAPGMERSNSEWVSMRS